jgi:uncharacterized protein YkwD
MRSTCETQAELHPKISTLWTAKPRSGSRMADLARTSRAAWLVLGLGPLLACAGSAPRPVELAPHLRAATAYDTTETPSPVLNANANTAAEVERSLHDAARDAGLGLRGDGRLALLAQRLVQEPAGDARALAASARSFGIAELAIEHRIVRSARAESLATALARELAATAQALQATHFGAFVAYDGQSASIVLTRRAFVLSPVPRRSAPGAALSVRGRLAAPLRDPRLVVRSPTGVVSLPAGEGPDFDLRVPAAGPGVYTMQLQATAGEQRQTLAELSVIVGDADQRLAENRPLADQPQQIADVLYARSAALRAQNGLSPLQTHAGLQRRAERISSEAAAGTSGDDAGRGLALHATAHGATAAELWDAWLRDPAARALLVNPDASHVGIGVAASPEGLIATEVLAQLTQVALDDLSPARLLVALNRNRDARGGSALRPDAQLTQVADEAARDLFAHPDRSEREIMQRANGELDRFGLAYGRVTALAVLVSDPSEAAALEPALDPRARAVGIAIARGDRPDSVAGSVAVVIALGYEREE